MTRHLKYLLVVACTLFVAGINAKSSYELMSNAVSESVQRHSVRILSSIAKTILGSEAKNSLVEDLSEKQAQPTDTEVTVAIDEETNDQKNIGKIAAILAAQQKLKEVNAALTASQELADRLHETIDKALTHGKTQPILTA